MVVVLCADKPVKWASFATQAGPEREFAGSLAVGAVHHELFSAVISLLTGKKAGKLAWSLRHRGAESPVNA